MIAVKLKIIFSDKGYGNYTIIPWEQLRFVSLDFVSTTLYVTSAKSCL